MINKILICFLVTFVVIGCANQQNEGTEQPEQTETNIAVEEISLTVTGMT